MQQGIRKQIRQEYGIPDGPKPEKHLVIDGNSLLKRCFSADKRKSGNGFEWGAVFQFLLQVKLVLKQYDFDYVCAFFDGKHSGYQRYKVYNGYKANREDKHYEDYRENKSEYERNMEAFCKRTLAYSRSKKASERGSWNESERESFDRQCDLLISILEELFIRTARFETVEGDDLVAYYTIHKKPQDKVVIMSGDRDLTQLISPTVIIYDLNAPKGDRFINSHNSVEKLGFTHENTALIKTICGDKSDNIGCITGFGGEDHITLFKFFPELKTEKKTINEVIDRAIEINNSKKSKFLQNLIEHKANGEYSGDPLAINSYLVDLSVPILTDEAKSEMDALQYAPIDPEGRDIANIKKMAYKYRLTDWLDDDAFGRFFGDFNKTISIEKRRFSDALKNS